MKKLRLHCWLILSIVCLSFIHFKSSAQGVFKGRAFFGGTIAQIQGDFLAGYDKLGLGGGMGVYYPITEKLELGIELTYKEKGSRTDLLFRKVQNKRITHLQYFEAPFILQINDWKVEKKDFHRLYGQIGLVTGYLFQAESAIVNNSLEVIPTELFQPIEFSFLLGAGFRLNKRIGINIQYNRAFNKFYRSKNVNTGGLLNYLWFSRMEYYF